MAQITRIGNPLSDSRRYHQRLPCYHRENAISWRSQWWVWVLGIAFVLCSWNALTEKQKQTRGEFENGTFLQKELDDTSMDSSAGTTSTQDGPVPAGSPNTSPHHQKQPEKGEETDDDSPSSLIHVANVGVIGSSVENALEMSGTKPPKTYNRRDWNSVLTKQCFHQGVPGERRQGNAVDMKLPSAIVLGEGSSTLYHYLNQHKDLAAMAVEQNFLDAKVDAWVLKSRNGIPRKDSRAAYAKSVSNSVLNPQDNAAASSSSVSSQQENKLFLDWSQNYLFHSDKVPARIQCIVPWVKFIGILPNPIDRALAQYEAKEFNNVEEEGKKPISFEDYVLSDIAALMETGVLQDWKQVRFDEFAGSPLERKAWRAYTMSGVPGPVGRGLYSIMIQQYLEVLPDNEFLFMPSVDWTENAQESYRIVLEFLGLTAKVRSNMWDAGELTTDRRSQFLTNDIKYILQHLFEPYNRRLETLLGKQWVGIWKEGI
jgi:hypothetical protein